MLRSVHDLGQSLWLDYMRRQLLESGELARLVREDGIRGVTSNPSIFEHAIGGSSDYDEALRKLEGERDRTAAELYEALAVEDIRGAADVLRPVYEDSERVDGYACLEVSPKLAHDTRATVDEARRLWRLLARDNVMIKVPATAEGIPAIAQLLGDGINVNVTLMFSERAYRRVADAYLSGIEAYARAGGDPSRVASVASIFVSRFDVLLGPTLEAKAKAATPRQREEILGLRNQVGIANAKRIYRAFGEVCRSGRFTRLVHQGARPQRILFASTSTKDPQQSDVMYVESLIGPDTVDTLPPATLDAFKHHGRVRLTLTENMEQAEATLGALESLGISLDAMTDRLLDEGVAKFAASFDALLATLEHKRKGMLRALSSRSSVRAPSALSAEIDATLEHWRKSDNVRRLWARDASLWTGADEGSWLDWLRIVDVERADADELLGFAQQVQAGELSHIAVLGMGGSSLCPDVLSRVFPAQAAAPRLLVLDSTDPAAVKALETEITLERTLFIVSSKSGSTLEPNLFNDYFFHRLAERVGASQAAAHFVVITDPDSPLERLAHIRCYARVFSGVPGIGGRYSALSHFGMVPAAAAGLDVRGLLERAARMAHACAACVPPAQNPGVVLGILLGIAAKHGRNKVTFVASSPVRPLGAWLEQLLAESTGKLGRGLIPIDGEPLGSPDAYGDDRVFAYLRLDSAADPEQDAALEQLAEAGHPVVRLELGDRYDIGQEFFRWEIATAVAGSVLGLHPFDQPDVEASKQQARKLTEEYERTGTLAPEPTFVEEPPLALFADSHNRSALEDALGGDRSIAGWLRAHLGRVGPGSYIALLCWCAQNDRSARRLQVIRSLLRDRLRVATCVGFGPRFLHSTGQAYKGGPAGGVFLHLVADDPEDLSVPGRRSSFGVVKRAQARGDFHELCARERAVLGVRLGPDPEAGLECLQSALREAL